MFMGNQATTTTTILSTMDLPFSGMLMSSTTVITETIHTTIQIKAISMKRVMAVKKTDNAQLTQIVTKVMMEM